MPRILLVDDDIAEISAVKRVLLRAGHQAVLATNASDAERTLEGDLPAVALVSATCDGGAAVSLLHRWLEDQRTAGLPVIVLGESSAAPLRAVQLARPLDPAHLADQLRAVLATPASAPPVPAASRPSQRFMLTALSSGSHSSPAAGAEAGSGDDRQAAADALRQRAEELRRSAAAPDAAPASESRWSTQIDEELSRLAEDAQGEQGRRAAEEQARAEAEEQLRAEAEEQAARAEQERRRAQAEEARLRAETEAAERAEEGRRRAEEERRHAEAEVVARAAEEEARRELAARRASRAAAEESARRRAREMKTERGAGPADAAPEPPPPPRAVPAAPSPGPEPPPPSEPSPPPPELARGSLAETPAPRLLALAARHRLTGRLDFTGEAPRSIYFEEGRVVGATTGAPHERIEELALRLGLVTRDQHRQAVAGAAALPTRRAAMALLDRGFLKPTELTPLVRRRIEEVVFAIFLDPGGSFAWAPACVPSEERTALERGALSLAVEGVRRKWLDPQLQRVLGGAASLLAPAPHAPPGVELGLSAGELRLLDLADGLRTVEEIIADSSLDPLATRQCLAALVMVGSLSVRFQAGAEKTEAASIDLARVREKLDQVRRADYFAILGLPRHCSPYEIREAAERLAAEFDPGRYPEREAGLEEKLGEILDVVAEARDVLSDPALRAEYLAGVGEET